MVGFFFSESFKVKVADGFKPLHDVDLVSFEHLKLLQFTLCIVVHYLYIITISDSCEER